MTLPAFVGLWREHRPDFEGFLDCLLRRRPPDRVPYAEFLCDGPIIERVTGRKLPFTPGEDNLTQATVHRSGRQEWVERFVDISIEFALRVGFDFLTIELDSGIPFAEARSVPAGQSGQERNWWYVGSSGRITSWQELEVFPWPDPNNIDYGMLDHAQAVLPEGMRILVVVSGLFEPLYCLMGLESLSFALHDQPGLVHQVVERVAGLLRGQLTEVVQREAVAGIWMGDDIGFNTGTFVSPKVLRKLVFPVYRELIELCHRHQRVFFLHACGNLGAVMDDLIDAGIDAKHSFEDKILPVEEAYRRWNQRLGLIGGLDVDILARGTEEQVRGRTREILDACGHAGGYALGSGNSIPDYVKAENFLAMLDEGRQWNRAHFG